jgi:hypothetical protein
MSLTLPYLTCHMSSLARQGTSFTNAFFFLCSGDDDTAATAQTRPVRLQSSSVPPKVESPTDLLQAPQHPPTSDSVVTERATDPRRQVASAPPNQEDHIQDPDDVNTADAQFSPEQNFHQQAPSRDETLTRFNPNKHEDG